MSKNERLKKAVEYLNQELHPIAVYLFGSHAIGTEKNNSDYDLAVLYNPKDTPSFEDQVMIKIKLEEILYGDVDLLSLNQASPIIATQVVTKGQLLLENESRAHHEWVTHLFSRYAELKEMRKPMENNILKRKYYD